MSGNGVKKGDRIAAYYYAAVYKPNLGGWREERIDAVLVMTSDKMCEVVKAEAHEAGSHRQSFNVHGIEARECGKKKRLSSLMDVEIVEA